jgi:ATP-dependent RNA circularization protein (DNA/RNA ligase family)
MVDEEQIIGVVDKAIIQNPEVEKELKRIESIEFNIFNLRDDSKNQEHLVVVSHILKNNSLLESVNMDASKLDSFLKSL